MGDAYFGKSYFGEYFGSIAMSGPGGIHPPKVQVRSLNMQTTQLNVPAGTVDSSTITVDSTTAYVDDYVSGTVPYIKTS